MERPRPAHVAIAVVVVAYAGLVAAVRPFTVPALVVTLVPGVLVVSLAVLHRRRAPRRVERPRRRELLPWVTVTVALGAWELAAYLQSPRDDHPTISSILDAADTRPWLRAAMFVAWIALGRELARP